MSGRGHPPSVGLLRPRHARNRARHNPRSKKAAGTNSSDFDHPSTPGPAASVSPRGGKLGVARAGRRGLGKDPSLGFGLRLGLGRASLLALSLAALLARLISLFLRLFSAVLELLPAHRLNPAGVPEFREKRTQFSPGGSRGHRAWRSPHPPAVPPGVAASQHRWVHWAGGPTLPITTTDRSSGETTGGLNAGTVKCLTVCGRSIMVDCAVIGPLFCWLSRDVPCSRRCG